jgi:hypothetical protein
MELYDSLIISTAAEHAPQNLETLRSEITSLDVIGQTYIFALVYYHCQENGAEPPKIGEHVAVDLGKLPDPLLKVLNRFTQMHRQRMNEQQEMNYASSSALRAVGLLEK